MGGLWGRASEHERVEALLSTYLDGRTSQAERAFIEQHVKSCESCTRSLATLRATVAAVREMPRIRAPRSFALPRSMARQPRTVPWAYPLLRTATAIATFLFVVTVGADLFTRGMALPAAAPQMAAPAALPPTSIAMGRAGAPEPTSTPQRAALVTPLPTSVAKQADSFAATAEPRTAASAALAPTVAAKQPPAPASETQTFGLAAAPDTSTPSAAIKAAPPAVTTEVIPPVEKPLQDAGMGGGGQTPGIPPAAGAQPPAFQSGEAATLVGPTPTPPTLAPAPTQIARAPEPQPPVAGAREFASSIQRPAINLFRIAEGTLAVLAITLGVMAWATRRRSR
jgi:Putative zinc-finger